MKLLPEDILENDAGDGDADRLAEAAEEGEEGGRLPIEGRLAGSLDGESHGGEEHTHAGADRQVQENPLGNSRAGFEQQQESCAEGGEEPPDPKRPAIVSRDARNDTDYHARRSDRQGLGQYGHGGCDGRVKFDSLIVENEEVQQRPQDGSVQDSRDILRDWLSVLWLSKSGLETQEREDSR